MNDDLWNATTSIPTLSPTSRDDAVSTLTEAQDKALSLLPLFSGLLSAWGSANIIYMVYKTKELNCYKRILLGLSCSDFLFSSVLWLQPFLLPADTSQRVWAVGNDATCTAMGFFQQFSSCSLWYNGILSFYFLLSIRYGVDVSKRIEPWMHGISIGFPLATASLGLALGLYGELRVAHFCYLTGPPLATWVASVVNGLPTLFFFCAIPLNNLLVYAHVRQTVRNPSKLTCNTTTMKDQSAVTQVPSSLHSQETQSTCNSDPRELALERQRQEMQRSRENERIQAVAFQAFLYVAGYVVSYLPTTILRMTAAVNAMDSSDEGQLFPLLLLQAILWPLQGLFNYYIYNRPSYLRESVSGTG